MVNRVPVNDLSLAVCDAFFEHLEEHPLIPAVVIGLAGGHFTGPVKSEAERLHLRLHIRDVAEGPFGGRDFFSNRGVLSGQAEGVPAHRGHDVHTAHTQIAVHDVI